MKINLDGHSEEQEFELDSLTPAQLKELERQVMVYVRNENRKNAAAASNNTESDVSTTENATNDLRTAPTNKRTLRSNSRK